MLHLIHLIPRPLHRAALRVAHVLRHFLRRIIRLPLRGVSLIVRDERARILLVRHSYGPDRWALPGGGCKRGEEPQAAAMRELHEEVGLTAKDIELLSVIQEVISGSPHTAFVFAARAEGELRPDRREIVKAQFFAAGEMPGELSALTRRRLALWLETDRAS